MFPGCGSKRDTRRRRERQSEEKEELKKEEGREEKCKPGGFAECRQFRFPEEVVLTIDVHQLIPSSRRSERHRAIKIGLEQRAFPEALNSPPTCFPGSCLEAGVWPSGLW